MRTAEPMFPILNDPIIKAIPWAAIQPHEAQARINHGQSLKGLASRGGLDVAEAVLVLLDKSWTSFKGISDRQMVEYRFLLMKELKQFEAGRAVLADGGRDEQR